MAEIVRLIAQAEGSSMFTCTAKPISNHSCMWIDFFPAQSLPWLGIAKAVGQSVLQHADCISFQLNLSEDSSVFVPSEVSDDVASLSDSVSV